MTKKPSPSPLPKARAIHDKARNERQKSVLLKQVAVKQEEKLTQTCEHARQVVANIARTRKKRNGRAV